MALLTRAGDNTQSVPHFGSRPDNFYVRGLAILWRQAFTPGQSSGPSVSSQAIPRASAASLISSHGNSFRVASSGKSMTMYRP